MEGLGSFKAAKLILKRRTQRSVYLVVRTQYRHFLQPKTIGCVENDTVRKSAQVDRILSSPKCLQEKATVYTPILPGYVGHNAEVEYIHSIPPQRVFACWKTVEVSRAIYRRICREQWRLEPGCVPLNCGTEFIPREKDGMKLEFTVATVDLPEYQLH